LMLFSVAGCQDSSSPAMDVPSTGPDLVAPDAQDAQDSAEPDAADTIVAWKVEPPLEVTAGVPFTASWTVTTPNAVETWLRACPESEPECPGSSSFDGPRMDITEPSAEYLSQLVVPRGKWRIRAHVLWGSVNPRTPDVIRDVTSGVGVVWRTAPPGICSPGGPWGISCSVSWEILDGAVVEHTDLHIASTVGPASTTAAQSGSPGVFWAQLPPSLNEFQVRAHAMVDGKDYQSLPVTCTTDQGPCE